MGSAGRHSCCAEPEKRWIRNAGRSVREAFERAAELPPEDLGPHLLRLRAQDPELAHEVERLVRADAETLLTEAYATLDASLGAESATSRRTAGYLQDLYERRGDPENAARYGALSDP